MFLGPLDLIPTPSSCPPVITIFKILPRLFCLTGAGLAMAEPNAVDQLQSQLSAAQEQVDSLSSLMDSLKRDMKSQELDVTSMRSKALELNTSSRKRLLASEQEIKALKEKLASSDKQIRQLQKDLADKTQKLSQAETSLATLRKSPSAAVVTNLNPLEGTNISPVYFGVSERELFSNFRLVLSNVNQIRAANPTAIFRLTGHASEEGSEEAALRQSALRAEALAKFLTDRGIPRESLQVVAAGQLHPLYSPGSLEGRKMNRRVEVELLK